MKRVRVLKEMPFAKVGSTCEVNSDGGFVLWDSPCCSRKPYFDSEVVEEMITDGWLEWVEEETAVKSLAEKFRAILSAVQLDPLHTGKEMAQIADDHYKEDYQQKFGEADAPICQTCFHSVNADNLRKALFGGDA